jgi:hypothetical protein
MLGGHTLLELRNKCAHRLVVEAKLAQAGSSESERHAAVFLAHAPGRLASVVEPRLRPEQRVLELRLVRRRRRRGRADELRRYPAAQCRKPVLGARRIVDAEKPVVGGTEVWIAVPDESLDVA